MDKHHKIRVLTYITGMMLDVKTLDISKKMFSLSLDFLIFSPIQITSLIWKWKDDERRVSTRKGKLDEGRGKEEIAKKYIF